MPSRKPLAVPKERPVVVIGAGMGSRAVAKQYPMWGTGAPIYFWAEQGLVWFEDSRDNCPVHRKYGHMSYRDALLRVSAVSDMVIKSHEDKRWGHERRIVQQFICEMEEVCRQAQEQGNPMENVDFAAEANRRRPKTAIMPQVVNLEI